MQAWRPLEIADIAAVSAIALACHPDYPERDAVYFDRLALWPEGCWIARDADGPCGYFFSHPYRADAIPALDTVLGALPAAPDTYYLHDLSLLERVRGKGLAGPVVRHVLSLAQARWPHQSLVAVNGSGPFWERFGFAVADRPALGVKLASYDRAARYMVRQATGGPAEAARGA